MDPIDYLWTRLTEPLGAEMVLQEINGEDVTCYCCDRKSQYWASGKYVNRQDSYLKMEVPVCAPCNALFLGTQRLGIEKGTQEKPAGFGKLGMLAGCGLIVTAKESIILTNPGWHKRISYSDNVLCRLEMVSGKSAFEYIVALMKTLEPADFPVLYISDLGRKKAELVKNLVYTTDSKVLIACSANGAARIDLALLDELQKFAVNDKKSWTKFKRFINDASHGRISPSDEKLQEFMAISPESLRLARLLPADPHEKLALMRIV
ncbi:MAG: hypothetical protein HRT95_05515 [Moritella sp.]|uniref:hypothetical protein n=1 Tax=Moritella sp. TaxID=78556 RepID=UPI001DEE8F71|nr:hypothetical protein [Moritella sp.]NQZ49648.1 hypothetical protein [Moritella sp.]